MQYKICRCLLAGLVLAFVCTDRSNAQPGPGGPPPAVGIVETRKQAITQTNEFNGRIEAINHVNIVARVTAFLEKQFFIEGAEVKKGDLLYQLEKGPFQADVDAKRAQVAQLQAQLVNAHLTTERARTLLGGPAGLQSNYDAAIATERSLEAQIQGAQAQLQSSQINLEYTDIRSPIDGRIGRTQMTVGNVVSPSSGTLTTIVSQDPIYVTFPVSFREALELRQKYLPRGGLNAVVIHIMLPDGRSYGQTGKLDFVNNTIAANTDTITLRGEIANPLLEVQQQTRSTAPNQTRSNVRELYDGEFVSVLLEGVQPVEVLAVPRAAVLSDQQGDYVYVVGADNKAEQRRVQLGQSISTIAAVISGLKEGEQVIVEGLQRVRPGQPVSPGPASPQVQATMQSAAQGGGNQNQAQPAVSGRSEAPATSSAAPPAAAATGTTGPKSGTTANAPAAIAPPAGQASSGTAGGAHPPPAGNPSARH